MKTWQFEMLFVASILTAVLSRTGFSISEVVGSLAVLASFGHASVSDRLVEKESEREKPSIKCYRWSTAYFMTKEVLWFAYFVLHRNYSALVGVVVFLAYPIWRRVYRKSQRKRPPT